MQAKATPGFRSGFALQDQSRLRRGPFAPINAQLKPRSVQKPVKNAISAAAALRPHRLRQSGRFVSGDSAQPMQVEVAVSNQQHQQQISRGSDATSIQPDSSSNKPGAHMTASSSPVAAEEQAQVASQLPPQAQAPANHTKDLS